MYIEIIDDFLSPSVLKLVNKEITNIKWTKTFTRAGSHMVENNDIVNCPMMSSLYLHYSSPQYLQTLEKRLGVKGIVPDPYMVGAGYSEIKNHGDLKPHIDFNWNDKIKLHRVCSLMIYLNDDFTGGELCFEDRDPIKLKKNRALLFEHSETIRHHVNPVVGVRRNLRYFYYASKLEPPKGYHRSLYGLKDGKPVDVAVAK